MTPAQIDLKIYKGSDFSKSITWQIGDPAVPVDLTDCAIRMQIRHHINSDQVSDELTTEKDRIDIDLPLEGHFFIIIPASVSSEYDFSYGVYDLEVVYPTGAVLRLMEGSVSAEPEVTR